jgi:hypothetical protein
MATSSAVLVSIRKYLYLAYVKFAVKFIAIAYIGFMTS